MKRAFFGIIVIAMVCFFGLVPSIVAAEAQFDVGDETAVAEDISILDAVPNSISSSNYVIDAFTSTGAAVDSLAVKTFAVGSTLQLVTRYFLAHAGERTIYRFITNAAGSVVSLTAGTTTLASGTWFNHYAVTPSAAGVYVFTPIILAQGNHMMALPGYTFIVE
ncbi:MAG: hypothetical protein JRD04_00780 [Deltaproteobacteria bacterium]|nr:hypothetical protein [Deltaproteobacteria bacterium]